MPEKQADRKIQVYITVGSEGKKMESDAKQLAEIVHASGKTDGHTDFVPLLVENHLTILHNAAYIAMQALYFKKGNKKISHLADGSMTPNYFVYF